ncbi:hypothetical protein [Bacillus timonensis]|nr:hypothetical protein [Bacillus timonensis]
MFVALRENGEYISLAEKWERSSLLELRSSEIFFVPRVVTKYSLKRV